MLIRRASPETEIPLAEPLILTEIFITGVTIEADEQIVRFILWALTKTGDMAERRIVGRHAMSRTAACDMWSDLGIVLKADGAQIDVTGAQFRDKMLDN